MGYTAWSVVLFWGKGIRVGKRLRVLSVFFIMIVFLIIISLREITMILLSSSPSKYNLKGIYMAQGIYLCLNVLCIPIKGTLLGRMIKKTRFGYCAMCVCLCLCLYVCALWKCSKLWLLVESKGNLFCLGLSMLLTDWRCCCCKGGREKMRMIVKCEWIHPFVEKEDFNCGVFYC